MSKCTFLFLVGLVSVLLIEFTLANKYGGGHSNSHYDKHGHAYKFGYDITDPKGSKNSRHESDDGHGNRHGQYTIYDKDGRKRVVEYVADKKGFRAKIHSNEPGLASHHAAHAKYDVEHHGYHGDEGGHGGDHGGHKYHDEGGEEEY